MADVKFCEGTSSQYANITPDEHTFYKVTNGSSDMDLYLGTVRLTGVPISTIGGAARPIYLSSGSLVALTSTVGGVSKPVYLNGGTVTALTATVGGTSTPVYISSGTISACTATIGTSSIPVYMSSGRIYSCTTLSKVSSTLADLESRVAALESAKATALRYHEEVNDEEPNAYNTVEVDNKSEEEL